MCLDLPNDRDSDTKPKPLVAAEDIICYKVLRVWGEGTDKPKVTSPYQTQFKWQLDVVKTTSRLGLEHRWFSNNWVVEQGFHTLATFDGVNDELEDFQSPHDHCDEDDGNFYIFVCVIPKGTKYFEGDFSGKKSFASKSLKVLHRNDPLSKQYLRNAPTRVPRLRKRKKVLTAAV
jgi:hypothetical protein